MKQASESIPASPSAQVSKQALNNTDSLSTFRITPLDLQNIQLLRSQAATVINTARNVAFSDSFTARAGVDGFTFVDSDGILLTEQHRQESAMLYYGSQCSKILPFLFICGQKMSTQREVLDSNRITVVMNCAADVCESPFEFVSGFAHISSPS